MSDWDYINQEIDDYYEPPEESSIWESPFWQSTKDWGSDLFGGISQDTGKAISYGYSSKLLEMLGYNQGKPLEAPAQNNGIFTDLFGRVISNITDQSGRQGLIPSQPLPAVVNVGGAPGSSGGLAGIDTSTILIGGLVITGIIFAVKYLK